MKPDHEPALDGLRGIAIIWVVMHNADVFEPVRNWIWPISVVAHTGWIGVQLFFVLSGYLITGNLLRSRGSANYFTAFYARRALRIFPLYFGTLLIFLVLLPAVTPIRADILDTYSHQGWLWIFLSNWFAPLHGTVYWFPHYWSLAVEEQFYMLWPFVIALVPSRRLVSACLIVVAIALLVRCALTLAGADPELAYQFTITRMDALAMGSLVAIVAAEPTRVAAIGRHLHLLVAASVLLTLGTATITHLYGLHDPLNESIGYLVLSVGAASIVLCVNPGFQGRLPAALRRGLSVALLRSFGRYSYGMYIWHMILIRLVETDLLSWLKGETRVYPAVYAAIIVAISYVLGWLSYHAVEKHVLALKRYFTPEAPVSPSVQS